MRTPSRTTLLTLCCGALASLAHARPDQSPPLPAAALDLRDPASAALVTAHWRYTDASIVPSTNLLPGPDLKPAGEPVPTHDLVPRIGTPEFESASWQDVAPDQLEARRTPGKLAMGWYRLHVRVPERLGAFEAKGSTIVLDLTVDDYAEVWVNGRTPQVLGQTQGAGGSLVHGWNTPSRVTLTNNAVPGEDFDIAILGVNGPISAPPSNYVWVRGAALDFYAPGQAAGATPFEVTIARKDAALDRIIAPGTKVERLAQGFSFTEGPVWVPQVRDARLGGGGAGGYLLFSDPNKNVIHRWDPGSGDVSIYRSHSGYSGRGAREGWGAEIGEYHQPGSNGLAIDPQGRLTICEHGNRRVTRAEPNGSITVLADRFQGKRLNSPNDLVYRSDGALYFTDPPFGLPKVYDDPRKETPFSGVYCLINGELKLVGTDLKGPNGLAFSPDEKHLYVDNWDEQKKVVMRYDVASDGTLSNASVFADLTSEKGEIALDGLKVDRKGNVYVSGPGGVWVFSEKGATLGVLGFPELPANFAWGDEDRRTLYLTARSGLYRVRLEVPGAGTYQP